MLTPRLNAVAESKASEYVEQGGFLKLCFPSGEVDFIVAASVTDPAFAIETVLGREVRVEIDAEIIGKKLKHRAAQLRERDRELREDFRAIATLDYTPSFASAVARVREFLGS